MQPTFLLVDECDQLASSSVSSRSASRSSLSDIDPVSSASVSPAPSSPLLSADDLPQRGSTSKGPIIEYATEIIRREAKALLCLADRLDGTSDFTLDAPMTIEQLPSQSVAFQKALNVIACLSPHSKLILTGLGKSGLLARKAAATFCSIGIPALFIDPISALHGDIGIISSAKTDPVICISYSGHTQEIMRLLPFLRERCSTLIALTSAGGSPLAQQCDIFLDASTGPDHSEGDSTVPVPSSSVMVALGILDALALSAMRLRVGWDHEPVNRRANFAHHHPGGRIGKALAHLL